LEKYSLIINQFVMCKKSKCILTLLIIISSSAIAQMPAKGDNTVIVHGATLKGVEDAFLRNGYTVTRSPLDQQIMAVRLRYNRAIRSGYVDLREGVDSSNIVSVLVRGTDAALSTITYRWGEKGQFLEFADIAARAGGISYCKQ
jgi:hypothetical protein